MLALLTSRVDHVIAVTDYLPLKRRVFNDHLVAGAGPRVRHGAQFGCTQAGLDEALVRCACWPHAPVGGSGGQ